MTDAYGGYGGIAQYNRDLLSALSVAPGVRSIEVLPRLAPDPLGPLPDGVIQHQPHLNKLHYAFAAFAKAQANPPDIVINGHLYHGPLSRLIARQAGARMISQLHGTEVWHPLRKRHIAPLVQSDVVLTVSRDTLGRLRDQILCEPDNGVVLANTVQLEFKPGDRDAARARFGLGNEKVLLSVGRLDRREGYKGHDRIISLLPGLRAGGHEAVYLIGGLGEDQQRLEAFAAQLNVAPWVRFLGKVPYKHMPDLYRAADLFVLPSTGEGFGIVFLEAMACGTPALGLAVGGAPDALGDGALGYCVTAEDLPAALARALDDPRPDPYTLHDAIQARFGQAAFRARVASIISSLH
jgi:phosphatidylinositol alpha-1,6-mannosyltransferase